MMNNNLYLKKNSELSMPINLFYKINDDLSREKVCKVANLEANSHMERMQIVNGTNNNMNASTEALAKVNGSKVKNSEV